MILVEGKTFVDLSATQLRETIRRQVIDSFAVLQETDHVMNGDSSVFHASVSAPDIR